MPTQLTISEIVNLPGVQYTRNGLVFAAQVPDDEIPEVGRRIHLIRGFGKWAMASVFAEMIKRRDGSDSWANEFSTALQMDPKERREILAVHTFFPLNARTIPLSYEHYREAMFGVADGRPHALDRALAYLAQAHAKGATVSQMRLAIRKAEQVESPEQSQEDLEFIRYAAVYQFRRFAAEELKEIGTMPKERAAIILHDLGDGPRLIDELRRITEGAGDTAGPR